MNSRSRLLLVLLICLVPAFSVPRSYARDAGVTDAALTAQSAGSCAWYYYPGATGKLQSLWTDPESTLPPILSAGNNYRETGAKPASNG